MPGASSAQLSQQRYYAHAAAEDRQGVITSWYTAQNGPWDWRIRVAAETLRRYPWAAAPEAVAAAPHYVYNGSWRITPEGTISIPAQGDWANGDIGQRVACVIWALRDYYRYSGDPMALAHIAASADVLVRYNQTPDTDPWPRFLVSAPVRGKSYGQADPHGFIQLDLAAWAGTELIRAYELLGNREWLDAARHWADLLAERRSASGPPWPRYANPQDVPWGADYNRMTGGVVFIVELFDELIRLGYEGDDRAYVRARQAGVRYLRDAVLPKWTNNESFGLHYWDWPCPVGTGGLTESVATYMMTHRGDFPNWRNDVRNILTLHLNHTSVSPLSNGDVYSGAWAYPESSACCGRSLWYGPLWLAKAYGRYGALTGSEWAREIQRRGCLMGIYDGSETGVVEDGIDGGAIAAGEWFNLAHPCALLALLENMVWRPEIMAPARENHIIDSSSVVTDVRYGRGRIEYNVFDAPAPSTSLLRLSFVPTRITGDGRALPRCVRLEAPGYTVEKLAGGDCIVRVRHDGLRGIVAEGPDPQQVRRVDRTLSTAGDEVTVRFVGNQFRIIGSGQPGGGLADVFVDGRRQLAGVDSWCPRVAEQQVLYSKSGLPDGPHTVSVVPVGTGNPRSSGSVVTIDSVQWSDETAPPSTYGSGGGPTGPQRVVLGRARRRDYVDSTGGSWRPGTEVVARLGNAEDSVARSWWMTPRLGTVTGTDDPELYRYGMHARDFTVYFTVGPGRYHVRVKLAESRDVPREARLMTVRVNDKPWVGDLDIGATAGDLGRAADLVLNRMRPSHGVIAVRFMGCHGAEAIAQAVEIGPGDAGRGATPVCYDGPVRGNLLANPGFEDGLGGVGVGPRDKEATSGWTIANVGDARAYLQPETLYAREYTEVGPPVVRTGREAARAHGDGLVHTEVYQEVAVRPESPYTTSAYVRPLDIDGAGFGAAESDAVVLRVEELDAMGRVVATHESEHLSGRAASGRWTLLSAAFTTRADTVRVRYMLEVRLRGGWKSGHVTFDDCALEGEWAD